MPDPEVRIKVRTDGSQAEAGLGSLRDRLLQVVGAVPGVGAGMAALGTAAGAAAALFAGLARSLQEFAQAERGMARLDAALANAGNLTDDYRARLSDLASELQKTTAIADDEWVQVLTRLVQFGSTPASIGMDVETVKNLAGVVGDLGTATSLYTRALQGNFETLRRYGILISETGTQTEKLRQLSQQAAEKGLGILEASANTLSGQFTKAKLAAADFFEALGQKTAATGFLQSVLISATEVMERFAEGTAEAYAKLNIFNRQSAESAAALERYRTQAAEVLKLTKDSVRAIQDETAALRERQSILDQLTDKEAAAKKSAIDLAVAEGRMSPQAGIRAKARVDLDAAKEKVQREKDTATTELRNREEAIKLLEDRKALVDRDLEAERKKLIPEEKTQQIRDLLQSAAKSRQEFGLWSTVARQGILGPPRQWQWSRWVESEQAQMLDFEQRMEERTRNQAALRRGRVAELEGVSGDLGKQLDEARKGLPSARFSTRARLAGAELDRITAENTTSATVSRSNQQETEGALRDLQAGARGARGAAAQVAAGMNRALEETIGFCQSTNTAIGKLQVELRALREQGRNGLNR